MNDLRDPRFFRARGISSRQRKNNHSAGEGTEQNFGSGFHKANLFRVRPEDERFAWRCRAQNENPDRRELTLLLMAEWVLASASLELVVQGGA